MSSEGLPITNVVGTDVELSARNVQGASNAASSSQSADSAATSADAAFKFSRNAKDAALQSQDYTGQAAAAAEAAVSASATAYEDSKEAIDEAIRQSGFAPLDSFEQGANLTLVSQALRWEANNAFYSWRGLYPKQVPLGSTPETTGGFASDAWVDVSDLTFRTQAAAPDGLRLIGACDNISDLRSIEPLIEEQRINLARYDSSVSTGGGVFWYDSEDTQTIDDGVYCVITPTGKRWKRDKDIIDATDAGISPSTFSYERLQKFASCPFPNKSISFPIVSPGPLKFFPGNIDGNGNTITFTSGNLSCGGNENLIQLNTRLSSATVKAENSIKVIDTSDFKVGDDIVISNTSNYSYSLFRAFYKDGEFNTVVGVDYASGTIRLLESIRGVYPVAETVIYKLKKHPPLRINALEIRVTDIALHAIEMVCLSNISLRDVSAVGGRDAAIRLDRCFRIVGDNVTGQCTAEPGVTDIQYGLFVGNSQNISMSVGNFYGTRHGVSHGGQNSNGNVPSRDCIYSNCSFSSRDYSSADTHGNADAVTYLSCRMSNGIAVGGRDIEVDGCRVSSGNRIAPVLLTEFAGGYFKYNNNRTVRMPSATRNAFIAWDDTAKTINVDSDFSIILERNEIIGEGATEFLNLPVMVPNSIQWNVHINNIRARISTLTSIAVLTKLVRSDSAPVADATTVTINDVDTGFDITTIAPVTLGGLWSGSYTKFNLPEFTANISLNVVAGEYYSADVRNISYYKYPSPPAISAQVAGNAFNGFSSVRAVIVSATSNTCTVRIASENTSNTFSASATYKVMVNISFSGIRIV